MKTSVVIKKIRDHVGDMNQNEIADFLGIEAKRIKNLEADAVQKFRDDEIDKIVQKTGLSRSFILTGQDMPAIDDKNSISINYYSDIYAAAGHGALNSDAKPEVMTVSRSFLSNMFGLSSFVGIDIIHFIGDSMEPFIPNGETILLQRTHEARNNLVIVARINDELFVKRLLRDPLGRWVKLISDNNLYPDIDLDQEQMKQLEIVGIVYGRYRPIS
ncbi:S24 family peptidase [Sulfuricurvum sp.]|uniref:S24 family peptidase n=1 Tax=Sulfuricurvum sp. TaxID=2025608 RepID=UPI0026140280|nr:S24 family peptidase [Sulfuricurvum sp.]MDD4884492.1 S24 family peptidase [Sulfuricurvum sp.]